MSEIGSPVPRAVSRDLQIFALYPTASGLGSYKKSVLLLVFKPSMATILATGMT
jgi:hypothetical protein